MHIPSQSGHVVDLGDFPVARCFKGGDLSQRTTEAMPKRAAIWAVQVRRTHVSRKPFDGISSDKPSDKYHPFAVLCYKANIHSIHRCTLGKM